MKCFATTYLGTSIAGINGDWATQFSILQFKVALLIFWVLSFFKTTDPSLWLAAKECKKITGVILNANAQIKKLQIILWKIIRCN